MTHPTILLVTDETVNIYGSVILTPESDVKGQSTQRSFVELEIIHSQKSVHPGDVAEVGNFNLAGCETFKLHVVEVNNTKHILQINIAKVGEKCVG